MDRAPLRRDIGGRTDAEVERTRCEGFVIPDALLDRETHVLQAESFLKSNYLAERLPGTSGSSMNVFVCATTGSPAWSTPEALKHVPHRVVRIEDDSKSMTRSPTADGVAEQIKRLMPKSDMQPANGVVVAVFDGAAWVAQQDYSLRSTSGHTDQRRGQLRYLECAMGLAPLLATTAHVIFLSTRLVVRNPAMRQPLAGGLDPNGIPIKELGDKYVFVGTGSLAAPFLIGQGFTPVVAAESSYGGEILLSRNTETELHTNFPFDRQYFLALLEEHQAAVHRSGVRHHAKRTATVCLDRVADIARQLPASYRNRLRSSAKRLRLVK